MESHDPFEKRISELMRERASAPEAPSDPFEARIQALMGVVKEPVPVKEERPESGWSRAGRAIVNALESFPGNVAMAAQTTPGLQAATLAGAVSGAILQPAENLLRLPSVLAGRDLITDVAADYIARANKGLRTAAEQTAIAFGATDEQIAAAYGLGNLIGFVAPVSASVKLAGYVRRVPTKLGAHFLAGDLAMDMMAGGIYGALFGEGQDLKSRGHDILRESAVFGVGRILINALSLPIKAYRYNRIRNFEQHQKISKILDDIQNGREVKIESAEEAASIAKLLSEESYISNSPAAQDILDKSADETVLLRAIMDVAGAQANSGLLRNAVGEFTRAVEIVDKFKAAIPNLKYTIVKNSAGRYNIFFGTKGLSNVQKRQLAKEGRFIGQTVYRDGALYEYAGRASRKEYVKLKRADGTLVEVKQKNITDLPYGIDRYIPAPHMDALYRDFSDWVEKNSVKVTRLGGMLEQDLINAVKEGRITLSDEARRAFDIGGAIIHPEELGLKTGEEGIARVILSPVPNSMASSLGHAKAVITRNPSAGVHGELPWRITYFDEFEGELIPRGHESFTTLRQTLDGLEMQGWAVDRVTHNFATARGTIQHLESSGTLLANILESPPVVTFETLFEAWARERGIPFDAVDFAAARTYFATRYRNDVWKLVPQEDRKIFEAIRKEFDDLVEKGDIPFEALAHNKGFRVIRRDDGSVVLRDINTGAQLPFGSERSAAEAIKNVVRSEQDMLGGLYDSRGLGAYTGGFDTAESYFTFSPDLHSEKVWVDIPAAPFRNVRDWLIQIEKLTGLEVFTKIFNSLDTGLSIFRNEYAPWAMEIDKAWKGLSRKQMERTVDFWVQVEGSDMTLKQALVVGKKLGLSAKELNAFARSHAMLKVWFQQAGIPKARFINLYYTRIRPFAEANAGMVDLAQIFGKRELIPPEFQAWYRMSRTGEMPVFEKDPRIVLHKYIRGVLFEKHVKPHWDMAATLTGTRTKPALKIKDLPPALQESMMKRARPGTSLNDPVLPKPIRDVLSEYLTIVRGAPSTGLMASRDFIKKYLARLGIKTDPRIADEFINTAMSSMYGAALALRPSLVARNVTQLMWMQYPRLGGKWASRGLEKALTKEGYAETVDVGANRLTEAGIPFADAIFENLMTVAPKAMNNNLFSMAVAGAMRLGLRAGYVSRKAAEKMLIPYASSDQMLRGWSYWWQKLHTAEKLAEYEAKKISWDKFLEDGLPMFNDVVKKEFTTLYKHGQREQALRFIGKAASDEANFIYGVGAQPAWMQRPFGRFMGMFGTYPMWALELYARRSFQGTKAQQAAFWARTLALVGAFTNMTLQTGISMWNWIAPASVFGWAGGPAVDHAINLKRAIDAPVDQKADALKHFASEVGRLSLPGQIFFHDDLRKALAHDDPLRAGLVMMLGREVEDVNWTQYFVFDDELPLVPLNPNLVQEPSGFPKRLPVAEVYQKRYGKPDSTATSEVGGGYRVRTGSSGVRVEDLKGQPWY